MAPLIAREDFSLFATKASAVKCRILLRHPSLPYIDLLNWVPYSNYSALCLHTQHHLTFSNNAKYSDNRVSNITCCTAYTGQAINNEQMGDDVERNSLRQDVTFCRGTVDNSDRTVALRSVCKRESSRYQPNCWGCAGAAACHVWSVVLLLSWVYCRSCLKCSVALVVSVL